MQQKLKKILTNILVMALILNMFSINPKAENQEKTESNSNIQVNLFDYSTGKSEVVSPSNNYNSEINKNHNFKFLSDAGNLASNHMNKWTGQHGFPRTKIVETELINGYPKLVNGESLSYLFDSTKQDGKTAYFNTTGLFQTDDKGYTYFNSDDNYAEFDTKTKSFTLNDVIIRKNNPFPCFYPFDSYSISNKKAQGSNGVDTTYNSFTANNANHYFGMTVETEFYKLENGKINGEDMVFNFSGDDDVWVFIDDKLVLDIGGIHTAVSGSINFNTGNVTIANDIGNEKTQGNIYLDCNIDKTDYTKHKLKVFYLERGNSASNCNISFNLPTIPEQAVTLTKKVVDMNGLVTDKDMLIDFKFMIKKNGVPLSDTDFVLYSESKTINSKTDNNGYFYLKNGQTAVFSNFSIDDSYEIAEVDYALNGYNVTLNGYEIVVMDKDNNIKNTIPVATSGELSVRDNQNILFKNIVEKVADLSITKEISDENHNIIGEEFNVELELNGEPYKGAYTINDTEYETEDGIFTLKNNETATIEELPYGTAFKVSELRNETYTQDYNLSDNVYDISIKEEENTACVYGRMAGDSEVISINEEIPNNENSKDITVKKEWVNDKEKDRPESIMFDLYKNDSLFISNITLDASNNWSHTFKNLFIYDEDIKNDYTVVETKIGDEKIVNNTAMGYYSEIITDETQIIIKNTYGGDFKIKKTINDSNNDNPIFVFKITDRFHNVRYEFIKFFGDEKEREILIKNIPLGECVVEEIDVLRYNIVGNSTVLVDVTTQTKIIEFKNNLTTVKYYSDVNYVKNHFVVGQKMEQKE